MNKAILAWVAVLSISASAALAQDKEAAAKARAVLDQVKDSVVLVSGVVKVELTGGGRTVPQEGKFVSLATVLTDDGLVISSLSAIDPGIQYEGRTVNIQGQMVKLSAKSDYSEVEITMPGGAAVPADVVLTNPLLDMVFIRARKDSEPFKAAKFSPARLDKAPQLQLLDTLVCVGRMNKTFDQAPVLSLSEVSSLVTKPRKFIIGGRFTGGPVMTLDGTVVGISLVYRYESENNQQQAAQVIVPAEDVMKIAQQAKTAKPITSQPAEDATSAPAASPAASPAALPSATTAPAPK